MVNTRSRATNDQVATTEASQRSAPQPDQQDASTASPYSHVIAIVLGNKKEMDILAILHDVRSSLYPLTHVTVLLISTGLNEPIEDKRELIMSANNQDTLLLLWYKGTRFGGLQSAKPALRALFGENDSSWRSDILAIFDCEEPASEIRATLTMLNPVGSVSIISALQRNQHFGKSFTDIVKDIIGSNENNFLDPWPSSTSFRNVLDRSVDFRNYPKDIMLDLNLQGQIPIDKALRSSRKYSKVSAISLSWEDSDHRHDAREIAHFRETCMNNFNFHHTNHVITRTDSDATLVNTQTDHSDVAQSVENAVTTFCAQHGTAQDTLIIFHYIGHAGHGPRDRDRIWFAPASSLENHWNPRRFFYFRSLFNRLINSTNADVLIVMDSCWARLIRESIGNYIVPNVNDRRPRLVEAALASTTLELSYVDNYTEKVSRAWREMENVPTGFSMSHVNHHIQSNIRRRAQHLPRKNIPEDMLDWFVVMNTSRTREEIVIRPSLQNRFPASTARTGTKRPNDNAAESSDQAKRRKRR